MYCASYAPTLHPTRYKPMNITQPEFARFVQGESKSAARLISFWNPQVLGQSRSHAHYFPAGPECCRLAYANIALTRRNAAIVNPEIYEVLESDLCLPSFSPTLTAM